MPMMLRSDIAKACKDAGSTKPVDLAHLSAQTMGDRDLEREVLFVFVKQAPIYLKAWRLAATGEARGQAAHAMKGAARGIGAWALAELAAEAEANQSKSCGNAMEREIERVCEYVKSLHCAKD